MKPLCELLETRLTPTVSYDGNGNLVVTGTLNNDALTATQIGPTTIRVSDNGVVSDWTLAAGNRVIIYGLDGRDNIKLIGSVPGELRAGDGGDTITGASGDDVLIGGAGADLLQGGAGNDLLMGRGGQDRLSGDSGDDTLIAASADGFTYDELFAFAQGFAVTHVADPVLVSGVAWDGVVNRLTGGLSADWFVASLSDVKTDMVIPPDVFSQVP